MYVALPLCQHVILYYLFALCGHQQTWSLYSFPRAAPTSWGLETTHVCYLTVCELEVCNQGVRLALFSLRLLRRIHSRSFSWLQGCPPFLVFAGLWTDHSNLPAFRLPLFPVSLSSPLFSLKDTTIGSGPILNPEGVFEILWLIISVKMLFSDQVTFWGSGWIWMFEGPLFNPQHPSFSFLLRTFIMTDKVNSRART